MDLIKELFGIVLSGCILYLIVWFGLGKLQFINRIREKNIGGKHNVALGVLAIIIYFLCNILIGSLFRSFHLDYIGYIRQGMSLGVSLAVMRLVLTREEVQEN